MRLGGWGAVYGFCETQGVEVSWRKEGDMIPGCTL